MPLIEIHKETPSSDTLGDQVDALFPTIVCGDFNTVWDRAVDRRGSASSDSGRESSMVLCSLFRDLAVFDAWRRLHPDGRSFSWTRPDGLMASRIDLFGFPLAWDHFVHLCDIVPCPFSDHDAVCLTQPLFLSLSRRAQAGGFSMSPSCRIRLSLQPSRPCVPP